MHRSRPFVLVILAAAAACSRHDSSEGSDILSQDRTLAANLESNRDSRRTSVPDACGATTLAAAPSPANQQQADALTQQAGVAEMHGDIEDARLLLQRAAALDGTNKSAAYHLGRTSEALGDRRTAMTAYCRYLTLAPTAAESVEARQRVAGLSRLPSSVSPRVVASAPPRRPASSSSSARSTPSPSVVASGSTRPRPVESRRQSTATESGVTPGSTTTGGDVVATQPPAPASDPSPAPPRTQRRGSIGVQSAIIGAAAGAILGATTGRSVKSAVIGAAAGGVLGTVVGSATRPARRSIRS